MKSGNDTLTLLCPRLFQTIGIVAKLTLVNA